MRCKQGDCVEFLESALRPQMSLTGPSEEKHRESIGAAVPNLQKINISIMQSNRAFIRLGARLLTPAMACNTPGPPTTRHVPGLPVR